MRRIYLIDCPGVVPVSANDSDTGTVLKGVVRVENLATPAEHIPLLLERVRVKYLERTYGLDHREEGWKGESGAASLLTLIARKSGKLLKGGEPDQEAAAKMVLNDWIRGKIPFFVPPPLKDQEQASRETPTPGETPVKGVSQPLGKIVIMTKFAGDDKRREEMVAGEATRVDKGGDKDEDESEDEDENESEDQSEDEAKDEEDHEGNGGEDADTQDEADINDVEGVEHKKRALPPGTSEGETSRGESDSSPPFSFLSHLASRSYGK